MSAALLQKPFEIPHTYADDLESFLHVTMHTALLYSSSSFSKWLGMLRYYLGMFNQQCRGDYEPAVGGSHKSDMLGARSYVNNQLSFPDHPALRPLLVKAGRLFRNRYFPEDDLVDFFQTNKAEVEAKLNSWANGGKILYDAFDDALKVEGAWPENDRAQKVDLPISDSVLISMNRSTSGESSLSEDECDDAVTARMGSTSCDVCPPCNGNAPQDSPCRSARQLTPVVVDQDSREEDTGRPGKRRRLNEE